MSPTEISEAKVAAPRWRIIVLVVIMALGLGLLLFKAGRLQLVLDDDLRHLAEKQYVRELHASAVRGTIYDRMGRPMAVSVPAFSIYAEPRRIADAKKYAAALSPILGVKAAKLTAKMDKKRAFVWLARRIDPQDAAQVRALSLPGIGLKKEQRRYYPNKALAGQVLGTVNIDGEGQFGLERALDPYLRGRAMVMPGLRDNHGRRIVLADGLDITLAHGDDVTLTLDAELQHLTEALLEEAVEKYKAKGAYAIVVDPRTGAIRAMANAPRFNPNLNRPSANRRNHVISDGFEPGSTFKIITFAAALDQKLIEEKEKIFCENGKLRVGRHTIHDSHAAGWLTAEEVFSHSSNIGTIKVAQRVGEEKMKDYIAAFGFGSSPGIGLIGESDGMVPKKWGEVRLATIAFGHGLRVTPLQMATAVTAVAHGGERMRPYLVEGVRTSAGSMIRGAPEPEGTRVMSEVTASRLTEMMTKVTGKGGTGRRAAIRGISVAGKTGTAEKVDPVTGRYSRSLHLSSFVGFAPAEDPRVVALVIIDEPHGVVFGGPTAGPVWRRIVEKSLIDDGLLDERMAEGESVPLPMDLAPTVSVGDAAVKAPGVVPNFIGLDPREAMTAAAKANVVVELDGFGYVSAQSQKAATVAQSTISLTLEMTK